MGFFSPQRRGRGLSSRGNVIRIGSCDGVSFDDEGHPIDSRTGKRLRVRKLSELIAELDRVLKCEWCGTERKKRERCASCGAPAPT